MTFEEFSRALPARLTPDQTWYLYWFLTSDEVEVPDESIYVTKWGYVKAAFGKLLKDLKVANVETDDHATPSIIWLDDWLIVNTDEHGLLMYPNFNQLELYYVNDGDPIEAGQTYYLSTRNNDRSVLAAQIHQTVFSDYSGSGLIGKANFEVFQELHKKLGDASNIIFFHGNYSYQSIGVLLDRPMPEVVEEAIIELSKYPILDEERHTELEMEAEHEYLETFIDDVFSDGFKPMLTWYYTNAGADAELLSDVLDEFNAKENRSLVIEVYGNLNQWNSGDEMGRVENIEFSFRPEGPLNILKRRTPEEAEEILQPLLAVFDPLLFEEQES